jgi:hypothetical protein
MRIGAKLIDVRNMTNAEIKNEGWDYMCSELDLIKVLVFDDGSVIYPSMDYEGNGPGAFFGYTKSVTQKNGVRSNEIEQFAI